MANIFTFTILFCATYGIEEIPTDVKNFLSIKGVSIEGNVITFADLYGEIPPNLWSKFNPGERVHNEVANKRIIPISVPSLERLEKDEYAGGNYLKRKFSLWSRQNLFSSLEISGIHDTTTAIVQEIVDRIDKNRYTPLIAITGDVGMGKSVATLNMEYELSQLMPTVWPVRFDLELISQKQKLTTVKLYDLLAYSTVSQYRELFSNVLEINPRKIVLIFDGVDHCFRGETIYVFAIIDYLYKQGATVIISGRMQSVSRFAHLVPIVYNIPEFTIMEMEQYLRNIWYEILKKDIFPVVDLKTIEKQRFDEYIIAFVQSLYQTPLPRTPAVLKTIVSIFNHQQLSVFNMDLEIIRLIDCTHYVLSDSIPSLKLFANLEQVPLNKMKLFDALMERTIDFRAYIGQEMAVLFYGPIALRKILYDKVRQGNARLEADIKLSKQLLATHGKEKFRFIKIFGELFEFTHSEYQNYFAAKYLLSHLADANFPYELFDAVLSNNDYPYLTEFFHSGIALKTMKDSMMIMIDNFIITEGGDINRAALDNLLHHGFDKLALRIMKKLVRTQRKKVKNYFQEVKECQLLPARRLGILPSIREEQNDDLFLHSPSRVIVSSRVEMLCFNRMYSSFDYLDKQLNLLTQLNADQLLNIMENVLTQPLYNTQLILMRIFRPNLITELPTYKLDSLLYKTINRVGDGCQEVVNSLVNHGAKPQYSIYGGRTLVHVAVEWRSRELLRFVIEDLNIPALNVADDDGRTVFDTALDANPFPAYTPPEWWDMMSYLMKHLSVTNLQTIDDLTRFAITNEDVTSLWFRAISSTTDVDVTNLDSGNILMKHKINDNYERIVVLNRVIRSVESGLSLGALVTRRKVVMTHLYDIMSTQSFVKKLIESLRKKNDISITELLTYYRGVDILLLEQHTQYRVALQVAMISERSTLKKDTTMRILKRLIDNVGTDADVQDFKYFWESMFTEIQRTDMRSKLKLYITKSSKSISLKDRLLQPTYVFHSSLEQPKIDNHLLQKLLAIIDNKANNIHGIEACFSGGRLHRRSLTTINCLISWDDIDNFNDAIEGRSIDKILINSDKYLQALAALESVDMKKAQQLMQFAKYLENNAVSGKSILTGNEEMLMRDVLQYGGWYQYRQHQRISDVINHLYNPTSGSIQSKISFKFPSRTIAIWVASSLPLIRGIHATISTCLNRNEDDCLYTSSIFATSTALGVVSATSTITPWIINQFCKTALDILPSMTPKVMHNKAQLLQYFGLTYGVSTVATAMSVIGIGLDVYNIVQMSQIINQCTEEGSNCVSKDKIDYIISLSFSCASILAESGILIYGSLISSSAALTLGLIVGLTLMTLQIFATGINDIIYYDNTYHTTFGEDFRIFFHKVAFLDPPADIQALQQRTDWLNLLYKRTFELLECAHENAVAYAGGIGNFDNNQVKAFDSFINMNDTNITNTKNLTRVQLTKIENSKILCYPQADPNAPYYVESRNLKYIDAIYKCENALVVAHEQRWKKHNSDSYIIYDFELIDNGVIVGSRELNNLFLINHHGSHIRITGGGGWTVNTYKIIIDNFRGGLNFESCQKNNLDLSDLESSNILFSWDSSTRHGIVEDTIDDGLYLSLSSVYDSPNLHIIGRANKRDSFYCDYGNYNNTDQPITIDGAGGESFSNMDEIIDCSTSILYPYTIVQGIPKTTNTTHINYVWLGMQSNINTINKFAMILPLASKFTVIFGKHPLLDSLYDVEYLPKNKILIWKLAYMDSSVLLLNIEPYSIMINSSLNKITDEEIPTVTCLFMDSYFNITIFPVIDLLINDTNSVMVKHFNVFGTLNESKTESLFIQAISLYKEINSVISNDELRIVTKLTESQTNQTFLFGSSDNDRLLIENGKSFVFGGDGSDIYYLNSKLTHHVQISNEANDYALDTLIIADGICTGLRAENSSSLDVVIYCATNRTTNITIILMNYLVESGSQHFQIYWRDALYVLLPQQWFEAVDDKYKNYVALAILFSFDKQWHTTTLTLTSSGNVTHILLNGTTVSNPLVAYRSVNNVVLTMNYLNQDSSSFVILKDFFVNDTWEGNPEWNKLRFFLVENNHNVSEYPHRVLDTDDIFNLAANAADNSDVVDLIKVYDFNITANTTSIIIDHNNDTALYRDRLAILTLYGVGLSQIDAIVENNSLLLCTDQICITVKNWCVSVRHRLNRIEFFKKITSPPMVIQNVDRFDCDNDGQLIKQLNTLFLNEHKKWHLKDTIGDDDISRLIRCIGMIFADDAAQKYMFRMYGFNSIIEQIRFMNENCNSLLTVINLNKLTLPNTELEWTKYIEIFELSDITDDDRESIKLVRRSLSKITSASWADFKVASAITIDHLTTINWNNTYDFKNPIAVMHDVIRAFSYTNDTLYDD